VRALRDARDLSASSGDERWLPAASRRDLQEAGRSNPSRPCG
jgi:hypothetical protein